MKNGIIIHRIAVSSKLRIYKRHLDRTDRLSKVPLYFAFELNYDGNRHERIIGEFAKITSAMKFFNSHK